MNDDYAPRFCEHCGGDKPWARPDWIVRPGIGFCSQYCADNNDHYLKRMIFRGYFRGEKKEMLAILARCFGVERKPRPKTGGKYATVVIVYKQ